MPAPDSNHTPRTALITGAGRGIGRAIAILLAGLGHPVVLLARTQSELDETASQIRRHIAAHQARIAGASSATIGKEPQPQIHVVTADLAEATACDRAAEAATALAGPISILVNAAGIASAEPIHKSQPETLARMLAVNLTAPYLLMRALTPGMRQRGYGRVVNIASVAGLRGYPYITAYCASKHGLVGLTRAAAKELAPFGVTVNAVCPGYVDTPMTGASVAAISEKTGKSESESRAALMALSPQNRLFTVEEVAAAVAYLTSDGARGVNGQTLTICGGELA